MVGATPARQPIDAAQIPCLQFYDDSGDAPLSNVECLLFATFNPVSINGIDSWCLHLFSQAHCSPSHACAMVATLSLPRCVTVGKPAAHQFMVP